MRCSAPIQPFTVTMRQKKVADRMTRGHHGPQAKRRGLHAPFLWVRDKPRVMLAHQGVLPQLAQQINVGANPPGELIVDAKLLEQLTAGYRELHDGARRHLDATSEHQSRSGPGKGGLKGPKFGCGCNLRAGPPLSSPYPFCWQFAPKIWSLEMVGQAKTMTLSNYYAFGMSTR